jgi:hypothetical protein
MRSLNSDPLHSPDAETSLQLWVSLSNSPVDFLAFGLSRSQAITLRCSRNY